MIFVLVVLVRSIKSAMESSLDFIQVVQNVVLNPDLGSAIVLFFLSFLNEIIAILPFAVVLGGQLVFLDGFLTFSLLTKLLIFVAIPVGIGSSLGAIPMYALAYFGGRPMINRFDKYLRFNWADVEKVHSRFKGEWYDEVVFLLLRCIPILPSLPVNVAAGILRMSFWHYLVLTIIGFIIRMILTLLVVGLGIESLSNFLLFLYTS